MDVDKTAAHWDGQRSREWVQAALNYYEAFPDEIDAQIADIASPTYDSLKRKLPQLGHTEVELPQAVQRSEA